MGTTSLIPAARDSCTARRSAPSVSGVSSSNFAFGRADMKRWKISRNCRRSSGKSAGTRSRWPLTPKTNALFSRALLIGTVVSDETTDLQGAHCAAFFANFPGQAVFSGHARDQSKHFARGRASPPADLGFYAWCLRSPYFWPDSCAVDHLRPSGLG